MSFQNFEKSNLELISECSQENLNKFETYEFSKKNLKLETNKSLKIEDEIDKNFKILSFNVDNIDKSFYEEPMVNKINTEIAVNKLFNGAESTYLLHKKYNRTNSDDEGLKNLNKTNKIKKLISKDNLCKNEFNLDQNNFNFNCENIDYNEWPKNLTENLQSLSKISYICPSKNIYNEINDSFSESINDTNINIDDKNNKSEVIINYCQKIFSKDFCFKKEIPSKTDEIKEFYDLSANKISTNYSENEKLIDKVVDIVKKVNLNSSLIEAEFINLDEKELKEDLKTDSNQFKNEEFNLNLKNQKNLFICSDLNKKKNNSNMSIDKTSSNTELNYSLDSDTSQDKFEVSNKPLKNKKMDNQLTKPLKGLLKKTKSQDSVNNNKKKRRVKFADTMMVFCDDWPEELMPQIIALKSPPEFNLVEIAAEGYMFEPPAEYKDYHPFDPPPDYRDCMNSSINNTSFNAKNFNFSNLPNHALLKMYENESEVLNDNLLNKNDFNEEMLSRLNYANTDLNNLELKNDLLDENEQFDAYKEMILNNDNQMLEEDDIIGVLKEDDILQAIGSQIDSLDTENNEIETNEESEELNDNLLVKQNSDDNESKVDSCSSGSIIFVNKNGNCQPFQIITTESSDISFSNIDDYTMSPNGSLQDLASDSSITSQDTIIMMTNAILTDKTNVLNINTENKTLKNCKQLNDSQKVKQSLFSSSNDSGIITLDSQFQETDIFTEDLDEKVDTNELIVPINNDENNNLSSNEQNNTDNDSDKNINFVKETSSNENKNELKEFDNSTVLNQNKKENSLISVSELRESFERKMSINVDKNEKPLEKKPCNNSQNLIAVESQTALDLGVSNDQNSCQNEDKTWQNLETQEFNSDNKNVVGTKQRNVLKNNYSPAKTIKVLSNHNQQKIPVTNRLISNQTNLKLQKATQINQNNINQVSTENDSSQQTTNQSIHQISQQNSHIHNQILQQPQNTTQQAYIQNNFNLLNAETLKRLPLQKMPNGNLYLSIDSRGVSSQFKMISTQVGQVRPSPPPYELSKSNHQPNIQITKQASVHPPFHVVSDKNQISYLDQHQLIQKATSNSTINNQNITENKVLENKSSLPFQYQTLPIRFSANSKQLKLPSQLSSDNKCCPSQTLSKFSLANDAQGKPQLILIHSYPNNIVNSESSSPSIAIKIRHPSQQITNDQSIQNQKTNVLPEAQKLIATNGQGKVITTATVAPVGATIIQPNLINSNKFIQQAILRGTLKDSTSNFPNPSEIRRRDGLNAYPIVWNEPPKPGTLPVPSENSNLINQHSGSVNIKDELETFVQQDIQRTERIKKRYSVADDDEDPTFGFARRPSVKGIKTKSLGTNIEIIRKIQKQQPNQVGQNIFIQNKPNIIHFTANGSKINPENSNPQIILASHVPSTNKLVNSDLSKLVNQPHKISAQAIPVIQKNNQRLVYLIQNPNGENLHQRIVQAGATLPRSSHINNINQSQQNVNQQANQFPANRMIKTAFVTQNKGQNITQHSLNLNNLKSPASNLLHLLTPNNSSSLSANQNIQRPSSSLGENKDNTLSNEKKNENQNINNPQVMFYHNVSNCNKIAVTPNNSNATNLSNMDVDAINSLQYKTISMPNVALIKSVPQLITLVAVNDDKNNQNLQKSPKHNCSINSNIVISNNINSTIKSSNLVNKQILSTNSPSSINSSINSTDSSASTSISSASSTQCNKTNNSNLLNTLDLVKDSVLNNSKTNSVLNDEKSNKKQVNSKDGLIFYSMNA